ncbi:MAG: phytoene/squalene synthase family protein [Pseudomonadota bacterium]
METEAILAISRQTIEAGSKSFATASKLFDARTRDDAVLLYAWCRYADDLIDGQTLGHDQQADFRKGQNERLDELKTRTAAALAGMRDPEPAFEALRHVMARHAIPDAHPLALVRGFEMDVSERAYVTIADTEDYCYHVAGVVGVMMAQVMGVRSEATLDRASDLGIAFQLTNIARDVIDDAHAGRMYLPLDWLKEAGLESIDPDDPDHRRKLYKLALRLLDRADPHYESAHAGIAALPWRSAWAIAAAGRVYRDIGRKLREGGPNAWQTRISTTKSRKIFLLGLALKDVVVSRTRRRRYGPLRDALYQRPV